MVEGGVIAFVTRHYGILSVWGFWQVLRNAIKPLLKQKKRKKTSENKWALRNRQEGGGAINLLQGVSKDRGGGV